MKEYEVIGMGGLIKTTVNACDCEEAASFAVKEYDEQRCGEATSDLIDDGVVVSVKEVATDKMWEVHVGAEAVVDFYVETVEEVQP